MCFSPKIKAPKVNTNIPAPEPAPLTEEVKGVEFGSEAPKDENEEETSGRSSLKVDLKKKPTTNGGAKRVSMKSRMGGKK